MQTDPCAKCGQAPRAPSHAYCRECRNGYQNAYRKRRYRDEPEYRQKALAAVRRHLYQLSDEEYARLLDAQDGVCAICSRPPRGVRGLNVDHDHKTGKVRALLCGPCNRGMGMLGDNAARLRLAAAYLDGFDN